MSSGAREWTYDEVAGFEDRFQATIDCTGGWFAEQDWEGVRLSRLFPQVGEARSLFRPEVTARLETDIAGPKEKMQFARVLVGQGADGWTAASTGSRQSNLMSTVSRANGLAIIPAGVEQLRVGDRCTVMLFREFEG